MQQYSETGKLRLIVLFFFLVRDPWYRERNCNDQKNEYSQVLWCHDIVCVYYVTKQTSKALETLVSYIWQLYWLVLIGSWHNYLSIRKYSALKKSVLTHAHFAIETCNKQVLQSWMLWLQHASNVCSTQDCKTCFFPDKTI